MKQLIASFVFLTMVPSALAAEEFEPDAAVRTFRPHLVLNTDPAICSQFLSAWTAVFDSDAEIKEDQLDLSRFYPDGKLTSLPYGDSRGLYNSNHDLSIDFDGDGEQEILHLESVDRGWRYMGARLYLFDSQDDYQRALSSEAHQRSWGISLANSNAPLEPGYRKLASFGPTLKVHILEINGAIYITYAPNKPFERAPVLSNLVHLNAEGDPLQVCTAELLPPKSQLAWFRDHSPLFSNLTDVYGGPENCNGTLGWTASPPDNILQNLIYRPQTLDLKAPSKQSETSDAAREIRFLVWGLSDPQSWSDYLGLKKGRLKFLANLSEHYQSQFGYTRHESLQHSEAAWRSLLDNVFYARNPDNYDLTRIAIFDQDLSITADTPPAQVAKTAVEAWLRLNAEEDSELSFLGEEIWLQALLASLYSRQPIETIAAISQRLDTILEGEVAGKPTEQKLLWKQYVLDTSLLAALGDPDLVAFQIQKGSDPNASTNWFGKTPLMYAAQKDQIGAVRQLTRAGAEVNAVTNDKSPWTRSCHRKDLERDNRTALMYAAENASPNLIKYLLSAGADRSIKDSQVNTASWYFGRNSKISSADDRRELELLLTP